MNPIIDRVTLTGADESVRPSALIALSEEFPFVEWGILFGKAFGRRAVLGRPRYPHIEWIERLRDRLAERAVLGEPPIRLSAHLCGHWMRTALDGDRSWWNEAGDLARLFQRVQLNFHAETIRPGVGSLFESLPAWGEQEFIFQVDSVNDDWVRDLVERGYGVPLFDTSHGAGIVPDKWTDPIPNTYCGFAGGIGPDNVVQIVEQLEKKAGDDSQIWIDMETRIRSADDKTFDLDKCRQVLERVAPYVR